MLFTPNLKGYWRFEGNANDVSGNGNNGTVYGATLAAGKFGKCYSFDGDNDYITVAKHASLALGTSNFTFACWYNFDDKDVLSQFWGNDYVIYKNAIQCRHHGGNTLSFFARTYSGTTPIEQGYCTASFTPDIGIWYHLAFVRNGAGFTIYVNGVALSTTVVNALGTVPEPVNIYWIGRYADSAGTQYMDGLLDEMILIKKALSASDIKRLMLGLHPLNG